MTVRDRVILEFVAFPDQDVEYVGRIIGSLRSRPQDVPLPSFDPAIFGLLYREFAAEDREIAELGLSDYASGLRNEENG